MSNLSKYNSILEKGVLSSIAAGPGGAFLGPFDMVAIGCIWTSMFIAIADKSNHDLDSAFVAKFVSSAATGAATYYAGCKGATWLFHFIPGAGTIAAMSISAVLNGIFTYRFGRATAKLLDKSNLSKDDILNGSTAVLASLCTLPSISEIKEILALKNSIA